MTHMHDRQDHSTHPTEQPADQSPAAQDVAAFHGMALFGEKTAYLYHLPMFMSSHDYQAIFEVALSREGIDPLAVYVQDRQENPPGSPGRPDPNSMMYAFAPTAEDFILTDLITPANPHDPQSPPLRSSLKGDIFRGHFEPNHPHEKMGPVILDNVVARVTNAVLFRKFNSHSQAALPQLEYFLFGKGQELFLAHVVTKPPDFDQILGVQVDTHPFTDNELRQGVLVTFPGRENSADRRILEQEQVAGQIQVPAQRPEGPHSLAVQLKAGPQFYFDTKDLSKMHM